MSVGMKTVISDEEIKADPAPVVAVPIETVPDAAIVVPEPIDPATAVKVEAVQVSDPIVPTVADATEALTAPQLFDRKKFFDGVRPLMLNKKLTAQNVTGLSTKLAVWEQYYSSQPIAFLAACLGQCKWETAGTMYPVREAYMMSTAARTAYLTKSYDIKGSNPERARLNGNTEPGDGVKYCGNGDIQITWKNNYRKFSPIVGVDLVEDPEKALDPVISAHIMFAGMTGGLFTGKKLGNYWSGGKLNAYDARAVVNGDKAVTPKGSTLTIGRIVADNYDAFLAILITSLIKAPAIV